MKVRLVMIRLKEAALLFAVPNDEILLALSELRCLNDPLRID